MGISGHRVIGHTAGITANITGYRANGLNHLSMVTCGLLVTGASVVAIMAFIMVIGDEALDITEV